MRKKILLIAMLVLSFSSVSCKNSKPAENKQESVKIQEKAKSDLNSLTEIKLPISDIKYNLTDVNGTKYVNLGEFQDYMKLSKNRFTYKIDEKRNEIKFRKGQLPKEDAPKLAQEGLKEKEYTLKYKKQKQEKAKVLLKDNKNAFIDLENLSKVLEFEIENGEIKFKEADNLKAEVSNDRDYNWYYDQAHTGKCSEGNCGPTSLAMILKWRDKNSKKTGKSLRNKIPNNGEWWSTNIFEDYFKKNNINIKSTVYTEPENITDMLNDGNIVLVCMKMGFVKQNKKPDESNIGRFYKFDGGHFLIVKGYKIKNGKLYYEVYDPNNWDCKYTSNGEPMGKDRLYDSEEVGKGITSWWSVIYGIIG